MTAAPPLLTVLRAPADPSLWAVYSLSPSGGVGPRCSAFLPSCQAAEALAQAIGILAEALDEAA